MRLRIYLFLLLQILGHSAFATHLIGGEMSYRQIPGNDTLYIVSFKYYRDCGTAIQTSSYEPNAISVCIHNSCNNQIWTGTLPKLIGGTSSNPMNNSGSEINTPCNDSTTCTNINSTTRGYKQWIYEDTLVLPFPCNHWRIELNYCCRTALTYNYGPLNPQNYNFHLETTIDNTVYNYNNSAVFLYDTLYDKLPIPRVEVNMPYIHTGGAMDVDGDSLVFETIKATSKSSGCSTGITTDILDPIYNVSDSAGNPFQTNNTYFLDKHTGHYSFIPGQTGYAGLVHKISEYRNGQLIGCVMRDFHVLNETSGDYHVDTAHICPGGSYTFPNAITLTNLQSDTFLYSYLTNSAGCDSTILSLVDVVNFVDTMIQSGNVLTSMEIDSTTTFQWITCNPVTVLVGDTTPTLIAPQNGEYAVVMSKYGCSDTSNCVLVSGMSSGLLNPQEASFTMIPNPVKDILEIRWSNSLMNVQGIIILDAAGRMVYSQPTHSHETSYVLNIKDLPQGIYYIKIGTAVKRLVKN